MSDLITEGTKTPPANNPGAAGGGTPPSTQPPAGQGASGTATWRDSLPEEMRSEAMIQQIGSVPDLVKSYMNAQSMIGKKGHILPTDKSPPEEWDMLFKALGRPELDKFEIKKGEANFSEDGLKIFKEQAHKAGLLPKQAQDLFDWFSKSSSEGAKQMEMANKTKIETEFNQFRSTLGDKDAADGQIAIARAAMKEFGGDEFIKFVVDNKLEKSPPLIKMLMKLKPYITEDTIRGEGAANAALTTAEIDSEISSVQNDMSHPYWNAQHPGHKNAQVRMEKLMKTKYANQS